MQDSFGRTALHWCAQHGDGGCVSALLQFKEVRVVRTSHFCRLIHCAALRCDLWPSEILYSPFKVASRRVVITYPQSTAANTCVSGGAVAAMTQQGREGTCLPCKHRTCSTRVVHLSCVLKRTSCQSQCHGTQLSCNVNADSLLLPAVCPHCCRHIILGKSR